jgi:uncharacterized protein (TIGR02271 family)
VTTTTQRGSTVVGVFDTHEHARDAIAALKERGFSVEDISVLAPDKRTTQEVAHETGTQAGAGAATGALTGGVLGGIGGLLVGIGALAIPGVGPFIAAGALATTLGGAAIGAGVGAIAGALVGMGVPEEDATYYEGEAKAGKTLVTVRADGRYTEAQRILREYGAYDVESRHVGRATDTVAPPAAGSERRTKADADTLQLREEEVHARKTSTETGQVRLGKEVVTEERAIDVPVTREEVVIERQPVDRRPSDSPIGDSGRTTVDVPVREERVSVEKKPVVYEEVGVGKREIQETRNVDATVRREELRVEQEGDALVVGWDEAMPRYRSQWQQRFGGGGNRWEDDEPAYRYGWEMRNKPAYRGRSWNEVEPEVQRDWSTRHPQTPWDRAREGIRDAWERTTD